MVLEGSAIGDGSGSNPACGDGHARPRVGWCSLGWVGRALRGGEGSAAIRTESRDCALSMGEGWMGAVGGLGERKRAPAFSEAVCEQA
jgi:hypothetical protein